MIEPLIGQLICPTLADKAIGLSTSIAEGFALMIVGMTVVFLALVLVGVTLVLIRRFSEDAKPAGPAATAPSQSAARSAAPVKMKISPPADAKTQAIIAAAATAAVRARPIDPRTLAIITAAATAVVGAPVRARRVKFLHRGGQTAWAASGRTHHHRSHNIQQRKR